MTTAVQGSMLDVMDGMNTMTISPRIALVTGSSRGLGRGIALELSRNGYSVAIHYSENKDAAFETLRLCGISKINSLQKFEIFKADISSKKDRHRLIDAVLEAMGSIDVLVNNAGRAPDKRADILIASEESFEKLLSVNLEGPYFLTQYLAQRWMEKASDFEATQSEKNCKIIIFVTSISAETASTGRGEYCISKAGLAMAAKLWAARLAESGVQVFEIRPGIMDTDMTRAVHDTYELRISQGLVPQKRWGIPEDVGKAVAALASGNFGFSTGSVIHVDGGFHISRL